MVGVKGRCRNRTRTVLKKAGGRLNAVEKRPIDIEKVDMMCIGATVANLKVSYAQKRY